MQYKVTLQRLKLSLFYMLMLPNIYCKAVWVWFNVTCVKLTIWPKSGTKLKLMKSLIELC